MDIHQNQHSQHPNGSNIIFIYILNISYILSKYKLYNQYIQLV